MDQSKNKQKLLNYLKHHELLILATSGKRPTACPVYYGVDDKFNTYIVTSPSSEHGINIKNNQLVACAITNTNQPMFGTKHKIGAQIYGKAEEIKDKEEIKKALIVWSKNNKDLVNQYLENINKDIWEVRVFQVKPSEIKWFNEELYGEEGTKIFKFL